MHRPLSGLLALALVGCSSDYNVKGGQVAEELTLTLTSPAYGQYNGDGDIIVAGMVSPSVAPVWVEGELIEVQADGSFEVAVPMDHAYRIIEVESALDTQSQSYRLPVLAGQDPLLTWPGGMTARLMPDGLSHLGEGVGLYVDSLGWAESIGASLPSYESDWLSILPLGVSHDDSVVELVASEDGLQTEIVIANVAIGYEIGIPVIDFYFETSLGYGAITLGGLLLPELDEEGMITLTFTEPVLDLSEPDVQLGDLDGELLEWVLDALNEYILEPITDLLLDSIVDSIGVIELGGPFAFSFDLFGTSMEAQLTDISTDDEGMGLVVGLGIDEPVDPEALDIPTPSLDTPYAAEADLALALHEGLFQLIVEDLLLGFLSQELTLSGTTGEIIGGGVRALPGGDQVPEDAEGWCLSLDPNSLYVARMQESIAPLAVVYMPDFLVDIGVMQGGQCNTWLKASLAVELGMGIEDGTALDIDLDVAEGMVLEYGATGVEEAEVIDGLGAWLGGLIGLLGGTLDLDLADLLGGLGGDALGGLMGDLSPSFIGSTRLLREDGTWPEGLYAVSMDLWAE